MTLMDADDNDQGDGSRPTCMEFFQLYGPCMLPEGHAEHDPLHRDDEGDIYLSRSATPGERVRQTYLRMAEHLDYSLAVLADTDFFGAPAETVGWCGVDNTGNTDQPPTPYALVQEALTLVLIALCDNDTRRSQRLHELMRANYENVTSSLRRVTPDVIAVTHRGQEHVLGVSEVDFDCRTCGAHLDRDPAGARDMSAAQAWHAKEMAERDRRLRLPPVRDVLTHDSHPYSHMTVRTVLEDGVFAQHVLYVWGHHRASYKTDQGLQTAITRYANEAGKDGRRGTRDDTWNPDDARAALAARHASGERPPGFTTDHTASQQD
ncbi:hypothetical protein [Amycolatopsis sp. NPDC059657]|uniref:hypothetical protein n=1 Tax=Amycolatopsis sp. NPDC059657 TaxID=3346899 RepID=UPI0036703170